VAQWSLNISGLWRRLGLREAGNADLVNAVQPVYQVGDGSALVPPVLPPIAWVGGEENDAILFHAFDVQALSAGGCFVRFFRADLDNTSESKWGIIDTPAVITGAVIAPQNMGPVPVQCVTQIGTVVALTLPTNSPTARPSNQGALVLDDLVYVPPGSHFRWERGSLGANNSRLAAVVQDVPEAIPASPL